MLVPRDAPLRWDESYGGEDALFCADALAGGLRLVFDPRFSAAHEHERRTFGDLRRQQRRLAYGMARARSLEPDRLRRTLRRVPLHYFALLRLPVVYRRIADDPRLRSRFLALLPRLAARRVDARRERRALRGAAAGAARRPAAAVRVSDKPILVTGAHRSGTTWVGKMLALAPGVAYVHEPFNPRTPAGLSPARLRRATSRSLRARTRRATAPASSRRSRFRYGLGAQLRSLRGVARRRPDPPRLSAASRNRQTGRAAAGEGPDRAALGRVARRDASGWTSSS